MTYINPQKAIVVDIETESLKPSNIWCVCFEDIDTRTQGTLTNLNEIREFISGKLADGYKLIFHNGINFDVPVLNRIAGTSIRISDVIDTFILSMLYHPSLDGGHSLESWGLRLKMPKLEINDYSALTDDMITYCQQDVAITAEMFRRVATRMAKLGFSERGLALEHKSWFLIKKQKDNGFAFDIKNAGILYAELRELEGQIKDAIYHHWPAELKCTRRYAKSVKLDGSRTSVYKRHLLEFPKLEDNEDGSYEAYEYVEFNLGSPKQRVEKLLELGWIPREFTKPSKTTPLGSPQPTTKGSLSPSLEDFVERSGNQQVRDLSEWININSRANMISTWMDAYNPKTGCIHGSLFYANTLRYRHSAPNTANIPAVRIGADKQPILGRQGSFTYEARDLWTVRNRSDRKLVGVDAKGIQLRVLAHYLNNKKFTEAVLDGDPHSFNQEIGGFQTRAVAKTFIYAYLLGAGDAKVGQIIGGSPKDGKEIKSRFINNFTGLGELLNGLKKQLRRTGRIILCDGTPIMVASDHMVLGYLLQGDESRIMRQASIYVNEDVRKRKLDVLKVGDIHDEWQNDVLSSHAEEFVEICKADFPKSGRVFDYRLPIACDTKVGMTWAETH